LTNNIFYDLVSRDSIKSCFVLLELSSRGTVGMFAINGQWWSLLFGTSGMFANFPSGLASLHWRGWLLQKHQIWEIASALKYNFGLTSLEKSHSVLFVNIERNDVSDLTTKFSGG